MNGCISNCGTEIIVGDAPAQSLSIGYFEAINLDRPCLNMKITTMDLTPYTHIHLAFGIVTTSYALDVSDIQVQWELFKQLSGVKKILSIGGWSFSADPPTYSNFRKAVKPGNQDTFVANIVSFVLEHDLDGIDIDWECKLAWIFLTGNFVNSRHRSCRTRSPRPCKWYVIFQFWPFRPCVS